MCSLEISAKEMNIGADRMAAILTKKAKEQQELNIWRQFGGFLFEDLCRLLATEEHMPFHYYFFQMYSSLTGVSVWPQVT